MCNSKEALLAKHGDSTPCEQWQSLLLGYWDIASYALLQYHGGMFLQHQHGGMTCKHTQADKATGNGCWARKSQKDKLRKSGRRQAIVAPNTVALRL